MFYAKRHIKKTYKKDSKRNPITEKCLLADIHHSHHNMFYGKKPIKEDYKRPPEKRPTKETYNREVLTC